MSTTTTDKALCNELSQTYLTPQSPSLFSLTSHLDPGTLSRRLHPCRWSSIYLAALKITVKTGASIEAVLKPLLHPEFGPCDAPANLALLDVLSQATFHTSAHTPELTSIITDVLGVIDASARSRKWHVSSQHVLKLLESVTTYMLEYVTTKFSEKVLAVIRYRREDALCLSYRGAHFKFNPAVSLHPNVGNPADPPWTFPLLAVVVPWDRVDHYAQEVLYLLSLAQGYYCLDFRHGRPYQPYVLTIRGTRISVVTTVVDEAYLDSVENMEVRDGLDVVASEEFDMAIGEERVRFVGVLEELLVGLVFRDRAAGGL